MIYLSMHHYGLYVALPATTYIHSYEATYLDRLNLPQSAIYNLKSEIARVPTLQKRLVLERKPTLVGMVSHSKKRV